MNPNKMTDAKLEAWLGKVLQPKPWNHLFRRLVRRAGSKCSKCDETRKITSTQSHCPIPDPIPLTPAEASKWKKWAVELVGKEEYKKQMKLVYAEMHESTWAETMPDDWIIFDAKSDFWLRVSAKCKLHKEKSNGK